MTTEKTSILARLTADIMEEKKKVNKTLTPVAGEAKPAPVVTPNVTPGLPADLPGMFMSAEAMEEHSAKLRKYAADLTRYAGELVRIADGIDVVRGVPDKVEALTKRQRETQAALEQREKERQADEKAKTPDFRTLQKAAQEAVFGKAEEPVPQEAPVPQAAEQPQVAERDPWLDIWHCPDHKVPGVTKTSSKGREYLGCPECTKFEW